MSFFYPQIRNKKGVTKTEVALHYVLYGQSLSLGSYGGGQISIYQPEKNLTFEGGPYAIFDDDIFLGIRLLTEQGGRETPCSGAVNRAVINKPNQRMFASTCGREGYNIDLLKKGSVHYDWMYKNLDNGNRRTKEQGYAYKLGGIGWMQGTHDQIFYPTTRSYYNATLKQLRVDIQSDAATITGNSVTVPMFTYQLSVGLGVKDDITLAQLDAAEEDSNIYLVTPMYPFPVSDWVHLYNYSYHHLGRYFGRAFEKVVFDGETWLPLQPTTIEATSTTEITATFNVPSPPLAFDTTIVPTTTDYGFSVYDDGGQKTVNSVVLQGSNQVVITVSTALGSNPRLKYAIDYLGAGMALGGVYGGGSGNLRDSDSEVWNFYKFSDPLNMYNWCVHFDKPVT